MQNPQHDIVRTLYATYRGHRSPNTMRHPFDCIRVLHSYGFEIVVAMHHEEGKQPCELHIYEKCNERAFDRPLFKVEGQDLYSCLDECLRYAHGQAFDGTGSDFLIQAFKAFAMGSIYKLPYPTSAI